MVSMPTPLCSVSRITNSAPAFAMIWHSPGVKNSNAICPSAVPPLRNFARTGLSRISPPQQSFLSSGFVWMNRRPMPGDVDPARDPHVGLALDIVEKLFQAADAGRLADHPHVQPDRHHPRTSRAFAVE